MDITLLKNNKLLYEFFELPFINYRKTEENDLFVLLQFFYKWLFLLQQVREFRIVGYALQFIRNDLLHLRFDTIVIFLYLLLHPVVSIFIGEVGNDGNFLVSGFLPLHLVGIHHNFGVENLLLDALGEIIRYRTDEHTLRKPRNLTRRDK